MKKLLVFVAFYFVCFPAHSQSFQSNKHQTSLLELYSSQGCSSCPPAEKWVSALLTDDNLWTKFVPIVFHVDYWNSLGWNDPFSHSTYSQRQRLYHQQSLIRSVYTPGFVLNGEEWRSWFVRSSVPISENLAGILSANLVNNTLTVNYASNTALVLNIALLGFDLKTTVQAGENNGRTFSENFIVLNLQSVLSSNGKWDIDLTNSFSKKPGRYALALWVNTEDNLTPLQATGGWIK